MKKRNFLLASGLFAAFVTPMLAGTPNAQVTIHVFSDAGSVATGIVIGASTFAKHIPGEGFGRDEYATVGGTTDTNGMVTLSVQSLTGAIAFGPQVPLIGFYWSRGDRIQFTNVVDGRWQPWNPTVELRLQRIVDPIPLYARKFGEGQPITIPAVSLPVGFDLVVADWLAPYGKGETADFIFKLESRVTGDKDFDATLDVTFSNSGDGIQSAYAFPFKGSQLRLPRIAPADGYESNLVRRTYCKPGERIYRENREDQNYFFRVRTKMDDSGNTVSALYGKLHGEIGWWQNGVIRFTYYLNATPNDRNLEFDPKRNLFTNLKSTERVTEP